ncbi:MAG: hypothetical protein K2X44_04825 [Magnetospirillum sp.]|nr:hypothetical protein [Magnetospirillum sp.]
MGEDLNLAGRVYALEGVSKQIAETQSQQMKLLERVILLEERQTTDRGRIASLETAVQGVAAGTPWLTVLNKAGGSIVTALATSVATFIAVKFGMPGG